MDREKQEAWTARAVEAGFTIKQIKFLLTDCSVDLDPMRSAYSEQRKSLQNTQNAILSLKNDILNLEKRILSLTDAIESNNLKKQ